MRAVIARNASGMADGAAKPSSASPLNTADHARTGPWRGRRRCTAPAAPPLAPLSAATDLINFLSLPLSIDLAPISATLPAPMPLPQHNAECAPSVICRPISIFTRLPITASVTDPIAVPGRVSLSMRSGGDDESPRHRHWRQRHQRSPGRPRHRRTSRPPPPHSHAGPSEPEAVAGSSGSSPGTEWRGAIVPSIVHHRTVLTGQRRRS